LEQCPRYQNHVLIWHNEDYMPVLVKFELPKKAKKRLPVLNVEQLQQVLKACNIRDKAIVLFMADSGLRREETVKLNWGDVDMQSGLVRVKQGKGKKDRSAVIGATTRRALLAYKRTLADRDGVTIQKLMGQASQKQTAKYDRGLEATRRATVKVLHVSYKTKAK